MACFHCGIQAWAYLPSSIAAGPTGCIKTILVFSNELVILFGANIAAQAGSFLLALLGVKPFDRPELNKAGQHATAAQLNVQRKTSMLKNNEMSVAQAISTSCAVLDDATLEVIAAGFDDVDAALYAEDLINKMAEAGYRPKAENEAALRERLIEAFKLVEKLNKAPS